MSKNFKELSRIRWSTANGAEPATAQLQLGCLQRIADASELVAKNYSQLLQDAEYYKKRFNDEREKARKLEASKVGDRAAKTRLKNEIERLKQRIVELELKTN